jgi:hypothetical protein
MKTASKPTTMLRQTPHHLPLPRIGDHISKALIICAKVYVVAGRSDIPGLKELAASKYEHVLTAGGLDLTASFSASLKLMYEQTMDNDRFLKYITMKYTIRMYKELLGIEGFATLCKEKGEIIVEILKGVSHAIPEEPKVVDINSFTSRSVPFATKTSTSLSQQRRTDLSLQRLR